MTELHLFSSIDVPKWKLLGRVCVTQSVHQEFTYFPLDHNFSRTLDAVISAERQLGSKDLELMHKEY